MAKNITIPIKKNLLEMIKASTGSRLFRHLYVMTGRGDEDILEGGEVACAFYVTTLLKLFNLIDEIHTTIDGTLKALKKAGWKQVPITDMTAGDVLIWDHQGKHAHIGFAISHSKAISNSSTKKTPVRHSFDFEGTRPVINVMRHPNLG